MAWKNIYFIGIGGIGMSAIARYYKFKGYCVGGYDRTPSDLTHELEKEGISVHYEDNVDRIPKNVEETLVVYTPAIPESLQELQFVRENGYRVIKRSRMLGEITTGQTCLAVSGTHGKTTTSTLVAHILTACGGRGNCGKCAVRILRGKTAINTMDRIWFSEERLAEGWRLGCQVFTKEPTTVEISL